MRTRFTVLPFVLFLAVGRLSAQTPVNDAWSNAAQLPSTCTCLIDTATAEPFEPAHALQTEPSHSLWWTCSPSQDTFLTVDTSGSDFDTLLAIYTGSSLETLVPLARNDDDPALGNGWSRLRLKLTAGTTYYLAVDSVFPEATGSLVLATEQTPLAISDYAANDLFSAAFALPNTAPSGSVMVAENPYFYATAEVAEPAHGNRLASHSLWWSYTASTNGVLALDMTGSTCHPFCAVYQGDSVDALIPVAVVRGDTTLTFAVDPSVTYRIVVDGETETGIMRFTWQFNEGPIPANDSFAHAAEWIGRSGTVSGVSTAYASSESGEPAHTGTQAVRSLWWTFTPETDGVLAIDLAGCTFPAITAVYIGQNVYTLQAVQKTEVGAVSHYPVMAGVTYSIAVDGQTSDHFGNVVLEWELVSTPPPENDAFSTASLIAADAGSQEVDTALATAEPSEPAHYSGEPHHTVWWKIEPVQNGKLVVDTAGSAFDTVLALYTGASLATVQALACNDSASNDVLESRIEYLLVAGTTYYIALDGYSESDTGLARLNWRFEGIQTGHCVVTLTAPQAAGYPSNIVVTTGSPYGALPSPVVYGYLFDGWWRGVDGTGDSITNTTCVTVETNHVLYAKFSPKRSRIIFDPCASGISSQVVDVVFDSSWPVVNTPSREGYGFSGWYTQDGQQIDLLSPVTVVSDQTFFARWEAASLTPPVNDNFAAALVITQNLGSAQVLTAFATVESKEPAHYGSAPHHTVWWSFTPTQNGTLVIDTEGSGFDTVLALYTGTSLATLRKLASSDSNGEGALHSRIEYRIAAGIVYRIALGGYSEADSGEAHLNWSFISEGVDSSLVTLTAARAAGFPTNLFFTAGALYGVLPEPSVRGYSFTGWWRRMPGVLTMVPVTSETVIAQPANHTLYARFKAKTCRITFDPGEALGTQQVVTVTFGSFWPTFIPPSLDDYALDGWFTADGSPVDLSKRVEFDTDQTLHARWIDLTLLPPVIPKGTPVAWLQEYGLTNKSVEIEELKDHDSDGLATWQEYLADTNPTNRESCLSLTDIKILSDGVNVRWKGGVIATQWLERRSNLGSTNEQWVAIFTNLPPTTTATNMIDRSPEAGTRFYRVRAVR